MVAAVPVNVCETTVVRLILHDGLLADLVPVLVLVVTVPQLESLLRTARAQR